MLFFRSLWWEGQTSVSVPASSSVPTGSIYYPAGGASLAGEVVFVVSVDDPQGVSDIDLVRIFVDGNFISGNTGDGDTLVSIPISTQNFSDGAHTVYAEIRDFSVNLAYTTTITVNVSNSVFVPSAFNGSFTATPLSGVAPLSVTFTASISGSVAQILWDFDGDGNFDSSTTAATYLFTTSGVFSPKMRLISGLGSIVDITNTNYLSYTAFTTGTGDVNWRSWRTR